MTAAFFFGGGGEEAVAAASSPETDAVPAQSPPPPSAMCCPCPAPPSPYSAPPPLTLQAQWSCTSRLRIWTPVRPCTTSRSSTSSFKIVCWGQRGGRRAQRCVCCGGGRGAQRCVCCGGQRRAQRRVHDCVHSPPHPPPGVLTTVCMHAYLVAQGAHDCVHACMPGGPGCSRLAACMHTWWPGVLTTGCMHAHLGWLQDFRAPLTGALTPTSPLAAWLSSSQAQTAAQGALWSESPAAR